MSDGHTGAGSEGLSAVAQPARCRVHSQPRRCRHLQQPKKRNKHLSLEHEFIMKTTYNDLNTFTNILSQRLIQNLHEYLQTIERAAGKHTLPDKCGASCCIHAGWAATLYYLYAEGYGPFKLQTIYENWRKWFVGHREWLMHNLDHSPPFCNNGANSSPWFQANSSPWFAWIQAACPTSSSPPPSSLCGVAEPPLQTPLP